MIAQLTGRCVQHDADSLILDVHGVGYAVRATRAAIDHAVQAGDGCTLHIHTSVREDAIQLYGFATHSELQVFQRLTQLQGVGPKVAIAILSMLSPIDIRRAADTDDVALLQSVPGVGPKVAKRIATELAGKLGEIVGIASTTFSAQVSDGPGGTDFEAREALMGLGIGVAEADQLLQHTDAEATTEDRIKQALSARGARA